MQISNDIVHFAVRYLIYEIFGEFFVTHGEHFLSLNNYIMHYEGMKYKNKLLERC